MIPAPKLKEAILSDSQLSRAYLEVVEIMHKLYKEAHLVHADLSEYNILMHDNHCWIIDVAQSVEPGHPGALEFLMRDCDNICTVSVFVLSFHSEAASSGLNVLHFVHFSSSRNAASVT